MEQDRKSGDPQVASAASDYSISPGEILSVLEIASAFPGLFCLYQLSGAPYRENVSWNLFTGTKHSGVTTE